MNCKPLVLIISAIAFFALVLGGCASPDHAGKSELSRVLKGYGYTMYTPLRTQDLPGTVFVLGKTNKNRSAEMRVSKYDSTFTVPASELFDPHGDPVQTFTQLDRTFSVGSKLAVDVLTYLVSGELSGTWAREIRMTWNDPKVLHTMDLATLAGLQGQISPNVRVALSDLRDLGLLRHIYLVIETIQVGGIELEIVLKDEFKASVTADKIKQAVNVAASVETMNNGRFLIRSETPLLLGYKAISFPGSILRNEVGVRPLSDYDVLTAEDMDRIKYE